MSGTEPAEKIEYGPAPDLPGVDMLVAQKVARRWRVLHETYSVCTLLDTGGCETEWLYRGRLQRSQQHELMLMEPGEVHANTRITAPASFRALFVSPAVMADAAMELGLRSSQPHLTAARLSAPDAVRAFAGLHVRLESPDSSSLARQSHLAYCLRVLLQNCAEQSVRVAPPHPGRNRLLRARDFIAVHYAQPLALADLAAIAGLSRFHFAHAFSREFGLPPHAYQVQRQVAAGRERLMAGMPLSETAATVGFADQSHFTRHFKQVYGVTPGRYLRART